MSPSANTSTKPAAFRDHACDLDNATALYLLQRVNAKDQDAFVTIHRAMGRRVFAFAMRHLESEEQAEEIVSDTMFEIWKYPQRFAGLSKFSTWVLGIARHRILDRLRAPNRSTEALTSDIEESVPCTDESAYDSMAALQREGGVRSCMEKLSIQHRECMHLVFYEGMPLGEVARLQGCPENTVKTRLFHARRKIQNCLRLLMIGEGHTISRVASHA